MIDELRTRVIAAVNQEIRRGRTMESIAESAGFGPCRQAIYNLLNRQAMSADRLGQLARSLGFQITVTRKPRRPAQRHAAR